MAESGAIRAGRAFVELLAKTDGLQKGLELVHGKLRSLSRAVNVLGATMAAAGGVFTAPFALALRVLDNAGEHLHEFQRQAARSGIKLNRNDLAAAMQFARAYDALKMQLQALALTVAAALAPSLQFLMGIVRGATVIVQNFARAHPALIQGAAGVAVAITAAGVAVLAVGHVMHVVGAAAKLLAFTLGAIRTVIATVRTALAGFNVVLWLTQLPLHAYNAALAIGGFIMHAWTIACGIGSAATAFFNVVVDVCSGGIWALVTAIAAAVVIVVGLGIAVLALAYVMWQMALGVSAAVQFVIGMFTHLFDAAAASIGGLVPLFKDTWEVIQATILSGDLEGAAQVAWSALKYVVLSNTAGIQNAWVDFTTDLQETWTLVVGFFKSGWVVMRDSALTVIDRIIEGMQILTRDVAGFETTQRRILDRMRAAAGEVAGIKQDAMKEIAGLEAERTTRHAEVDEGIQAAKRQWEDAIAALRNKARNNIDSGYNLATQVQVRGTFSAAAVGALGSDKLNELVLVGKETNKKLDAINAGIRASFNPLKVK